MGHYDDYYEEEYSNRIKIKRKQLAQLFSEYKTTFDDMKLFFRDLNIVDSKNEHIAIMEAWENFEDKLNRVKINNGVLIINPSILIDELTKGE